MFLQTAWKVLRLWRCPARCYRGLSASWRSSVQLASHRTLCIDQQRACLRSSTLQSELPLASFPTLAHSKFIFLKPNLHMFYIFAFTLELARLAVCAVTCHTESQNHSKYPEILIPEILIIVYTGGSCIWYDCKEFKFSSSPEVLSSDQQLGLVGHQACLGICSSSW